MKTIEPVAIFHSPFNTKFGIPRQSGLVDLKGRIVFEPSFKDANAIRGIEDFDYLWLIWGFSANKQNGNRKASLTVRPPRLGGNKRVGVFASRSPFRPNGLGLSSVKFVGIDKGDIIVSGADLMDGTPIYDIKPYIPYADAHPNVKGGFTDNREWHKLEVVFPEKERGKLSEKEFSELSAILALDPRPHYQNDAERIYGMSFGHYDVRFKVADDVLTVVGIEGA